MKDRTRRCFATLVLLGAALLPAASGAEEEGVSRCAKLEKADERLICYDELARATESPSGAPVDLTPTPSHLSEDWKLGAKQGGVRRLTDIKGYRPNYILTRWTSSPNTQPTSPAPGRSSPEAQDLQHNELKFQISLKTELVSRQAFEELGVTPLLGYVGIDSVRLWFAYTHRVHWQVYNTRASRPFRETNYEPEAILTFGTGNEGNGFKLINLGLSHQSNGIDPREHRGWSRWYVQGGWEWGSFSVLARLWHIIPQSDDDNPNIDSFYGHGDIVARYQSARGVVTSVLLRGNDATGLGFVQVDMASPSLRALGGLKFHLQLTSGYGETLIDYNFRQRTIGVGVSFGDW